MNFRLLVTPTHFDVQIDSNLTALAPRLEQNRGGRLSLSELANAPNHEAHDFITTRRH
jgi:hypothetical protein